MKTIKLIAFALIFLIAISNVSASWATIGRVGLKYVAPGVGDAINTAICLVSIVTCVQGQVAGAVVGEAYNQALGAVSNVLGEEVARQTAEALSTYNQFKGYADDGATVVKELSVDNKGYIESGSIQFKKADGTAASIDMQNVKFAYDKENGEGTYTFKADGALKINEDEFKNINAGGNIQTDKEGNIVSASFIANEQGGTYKFPGVEPITAANMQISYGCKEGGGAKDCFATALPRDGAEPTSFTFQNKKINLASQSIDMRGNEVFGNDFEIEDEFLGKIKIENAYDLESGRVAIEGKGYVVNPHTQISIPGKFDFESKEEKIFLTGTRDAIDTSKYPNYARFRKDETTNKETLVINGNLKVKTPVGAQWTNAVATKNAAEFTVQGRKMIVSSDRVAVPEGEGVAVYKSGSTEMNFDKNKAEKNPVIKDEDSEERDIYHKDKKYEIKPGSVGGLICQAETTISGDTILGMAIHAITGKDVEQECKEKCGWTFAKTDTKQVKEVTFPEGDKKYELALSEEVPETQKRKFTGKVYADKNAIKYQNLPVEYYSVGKEVTGRDYLDQTTGTYKSVEKKVDIYVDVNGNPRKLTSTTSFKTGEYSGWKIDESKLSSALKTWIEPPKWEIEREGNKYFEVVPESEGALISGSRREIYQIKIGSTTIFTRKDPSLLKPAE